MTFYDKLVAAGLPVISADESGAVSMGATTAEQQAIFADIVLEYFQPSAYAELLQQRADIQAIKDTYLAMIARLEQIQNAGAIPFTQAGFNQVVQAVKDEALYIERIMKYLKGLLE